MYNSTQQLDISDREYIDSNQEQQVQVEQANNQQTNHGAALNSIAAGHTGHCETEHQAGGKTEKQSRVDKLSTAVISTVGCSADGVSTGADGLSTPQPHSRNRLGLVGTKGGSLSTSGISVPTGASSLHASHCSDEVRDWCAPVEDAEKQRQSSKPNITVIRSSDSAWPDTYNTTASPSQDTRNAAVKDSIYNSQDRRKRIARGSNSYKLDTVTCIGAAPSYCQRTDTRAGGGSDEGNGGGSNGSRSGFGSGSGVGNDSGITTERRDLYDTDSNSNTAAESGSGANITQAEQLSGDETLSDDVLRVERMKTFFCNMYCKELQVRNLHRWKDNRDYAYLTELKIRRMQQSEETINIYAPWSSAEERDADNAHMGRAIDREEEAIRAALSHIKVHKLQPERVRFAVYHESGGYSITSHLDQRFEFRNYKFNPTVKETIHVEIDFGIEPRTSTDYVITQLDSACAISREYQPEQSEVRLITEWQSTTGIEEVVAALHRGEEIVTMELQKNDSVSGDGPTLVVTRMFRECQTCMTSVRLNSERQSGNPIRWARDSTQQLGLTYTNVV